MRVPQRVQRRAAPKLGQERLKATTGRAVDDGLAERAERAGLAERVLGVGAVEPAGGHVDRGGQLRFRDPRVAIRVQELGEDGRELATHGERADVEVLEELADLLWSQCLNVAILKAVLRE